MDKNHFWSNLVIGAGTVMVAFAIPHLIDDFLYQIPEEFGLTNPQAQLLAGIFAAILIVVFSLAARGNRSGYIGAAFLGAFLALAVILKHIPKILLPEPYWGGWFSEALILGLMVSGVILTAVSLRALRSSKE